MPELPEVEVVKRSLEKKIKNMVFLSVILVKLIVDLLKLLLVLVQLKAMIRILD